MDTGTKINPSNLRSTRTGTHLWLRIYIQKQEHTAHMTIPMNQNLGPPLTTTTQGTID